MFFVVVVVVFCVFVVAVFLSFFAFNHVNAKKEMSIRLVLS